MINKIWQKGSKTISKRENEREEGLMKYGSSGRGRWDHTPRTESTTDQMETLASLAGKPRALNREAKT